MGSLVKHNNPMDEMREHISQLNVEVEAFVTPLEQKAKYNEIQVADNKLDAIHETSIQVKKTLRDFTPTAQSTYIKLQQLYFITNAN